MNVGMFLAIILALSFLPSAAADEEAAKITLYRFFGGCSDEYSAVTDPARAVGECGVIQVLTNKFNAEHKGDIEVRTQSIQAGGYYDRLSAAFAARRPPDIAIMHRSLLPDFVQRALLLPLSAQFPQDEIDWDDFVEPARAGVTFDGEIYALPFDFHALLWHINVDLFARSGLVDASGRPRLPASPGELLAQANVMRSSTGKRYLAIPSVMDPMPAWTIQTWIWQQGGRIISDEGNFSNLDQPAALRALTLLNSLYQQDFASPTQDYVGAEQAFLRGEAAVLVNGTWVVDSYRSRSRRQVPFMYAAETVPQLFTEHAAWSDSHVWVVPRRMPSDPRRDTATRKFLKFLYDQSGEWARTGHLPVRRSVLESDYFESLPERANFSGTAHIARTLQPVENQRAIQHLLVQELNATWLAPRPPVESLAEAHRELNEILKRSIRSRTRRKAESKTLH